MDVTFAGDPEHYGGPQPKELQFANINGDAWPDLVVDSGDRNVPTGGAMTVLLGDGGKSWSVAQEFVTTHRILALLAFDFDGNGDDDVAYTDASKIRVLTNENGSLRETHVLTPQGLIGGTDLVAGDFNGDGRVDFAATNPATILLLSRPDGTFASSHVVSTPAFASAGDLDGDGLDDLVVGGSNNDLLIFRGDAVRGLGDPRAVAMPRVPILTGIGDLNGDGTADIFASNPQTRFIDVLSSANDPAAARAQTVLRDNTAAVVPVMGDINGDGMDDVTFYDRTYGVRSFLGSADASLPMTPGYWVPRQGSNGRIGGHDVGAADVDRDGDLDVAIVTESGFVILRNDGTGFTAPRFAAFARAIGDLNEDGRDDVIDHGGIVRLAAPNGLFQPATVLETFGEPNYRFVAIADMNRDGNLDAVFSDSRVTRGITVRLGDGTGALAPPGPAVLAGFGIPADLTIADMNGDGNPDVVVTGGSPNGVVLGDGKGGLASSPIGDTGIGDVAAGDLDGDGHVDLVTSLDGIRWNDGTGQLTAAPLGAVVAHVAIADMNEDGRMDIVTAASGYLYASIAIHLGNGSRSFTKLDNVEAPVTDLRGIDVRDFNSDGHLCARSPSKCRPATSTATGARTSSTAVSCGAIRAARRRDGGRSGRSVVGCRSTTARRVQ